ncbi:unnamed protein product, partial [Prorocentrum cordatum]
AASGLQPPAAVRPTTPSAVAAAGGRSHAPSDPAPAAAPPPALHAPVTPLRRAYTTGDLDAVERSPRRLSRGTASPGDDPQNQALHGHVPSSSSSQAPEGARLETARREGAAGPGQPHGLALRPPRLLRAGAPGRFKITTPSQPAQAPCNASSGPPSESSGRATPQTYTSRGQEEDADEDAWDEDVGEEDEEHKQQAWSGDERGLPPARRGSLVSALSRPSRDSRGSDSRVITMRAPLEHEDEGKLEERIRRGIQDAERRRRAAQLRLDDVNRLMEKRTTGCAPKPGRVRLIPLHAAP